MRAELLDVILGENKIIDLPLHEISEIREKLKGKETEPENIISLLRARIAELEWLLCESEEVLHAAAEHIKTLEGKDNFLTKESRERPDEYCLHHGHDWFRHQYVGPGDINYLTCKRCGAETTD